MPVAAVWFALLLLSQWPLAGSAATEEHVEVVGRLGRGSVAIAVSDGLAYAIELQYDQANASLSDARLRVVSVADPTQPVQLGSTILGDRTTSVHGVQVAKGHAYVSATQRDSASYAILVVDVTDPAHPRQVGSISFTAPARNFGFSGDYLVVTQYLGFDSPGSGLDVLDLARPTDPQRISHIDLLTGTDINGRLAVWGTTAYVLGATSYLAQSTFYVVDLAEPKKPRVTGGMAVATGYPKVAGLAGAADGYVYLWSDCLNSSLCSFLGYRTLSFVIDATDPAHPRAVGLSGFEPGKLLFEGSLGYADGLHVIDVSDPARPVRVGNYYPNYDYFPVGAVDCGLVYLLGTEGRIVRFTGYGPPPSSGGFRTFIPTASRTGCEPITRPTVRTSTPTPSTTPTATATATTTGTPTPSPSAVPTTTSTATPT